MSTVALSIETAVKSVLIATDFTKASERPLQRALAIAHHFGAKFYLTHVVSSMGFTLAGPPALELACESAARDVQKLANSLLHDGSLAGLEHEFVVRRGIVWEELRDMISKKHIDLVVLGTHARHTLGKLVLGSVAEQVFRSADCLVLTVGPGSLRDSPLQDGRPFHPFVFATDFSEASSHALPRAVSFANQFAAKLVLLHVAPIAPIPEGFHWSSTTMDVRQLRENARSAALTRINDMLTLCEPLAIPPEFVVKFGPPAKTILQVAAEFDADLLVMGLNRSRHFEAAAHAPWDIAYEVVCGSRCPVLTVRM